MSRMLATIPLAILLVTSCLDGRQAAEVKRFPAKPVSSSDSDSEANPTPTAGPTAQSAASQCSNAVEFPPAVPSSGQIAITLGLTGQDPCSVEGYVVGQREALRFVPTKSGEYVADKVPSGNYDIIVTAGTLSVQTGASLTEAGGDQGIRINDIRVDNGQRANRPAVRLGVVGKIKGVAKLQGQTDHSGIRVYIPGTSFQATTGPEGAYEMSDVVPGSHDLRFEKLNFREGIVAEVVLESASVAIAPPVDLAFQNGESGPIFLSDQSEVLMTRQIEFFVYPEGSPQLMQVSESPFFENVTWQPFQTSGKFVFAMDSALKEGGKSTKVLYIKLQEEALTSVLAQTVKIDLFADLRNETVLSADESRLVGKATAMLKVKKPVNAVAMKISTDPTFLNAAWEEVNETTELQLENLGPNKVYLKFKTDEDAQSEAYQSSVELDLFPAGSVAFQVMAPVIDASYKPEFELVNITHPLTEEGSLFLASDPEFADFKELSRSLTGTRFELSVGAAERPCGTQKIYLKAMHKATGLESAVVSRDVEYRCARLLGDRGLTGDDFSNSAETLLMGKRLVLWGGSFNDGIYYDIAEQRWFKITAVGAPSESFDAHLFDYGGKLVVAGSGDVLEGGVYDFETRLWEKISNASAALPVLGGVANHDQSSGLKVLDVALIGDRLIYLASMYDAFELLVTSYDLKSKAWSQFAQTGPVPRGFSRRSNYLFADGYLFVFGGANGQGGDPRVAADKHYYLDLETGVWTEMATEGQPSARSDSFVIWSGSHFYVVGGVTLNGTALADAAKFDPVTNTWSAVATMPGERINASFETFAEWFGDKLYIWSGSSSSTDLLWSGVAYDAAKNTWAPMEDDGAPTLSEDLVYARDGKFVYVSTTYSNRALPLDKTLRRFNLETAKWEDFIGTIPVSNHDPRRRFPKLQVKFGRLFHYLGLSANNDVPTDSLLIFTEQSPLILSNLQLDSAATASVAAGSSLAVSLQGRNMMSGLKDTKFKLRVTAGPAAVLAAEKTIADIAPNATFQIQGLRLRINPTAKIGDLIDIEVSYTTPNGYAGSLTHQLVVVGGGFSLAKVEFPSEGLQKAGTGSLGVTVKAQGGVAIPRPTITVEKGPCLASASLTTDLAALPDPLAAGSSILLAVQVSGDGTCSHGSASYVTLKFSGNSADVRADFRIGVRKHIATFSSDPTSATEGLFGSIDADHFPDQTLDVPSEFEIEIKDIPAGEVLDNFIVRSSSYTQSDYIEPEIVDPDSNVIDLLDGASAAGMDFRTDKRPFKNNPSLNFETFAVDLLDVKRVQRLQQAANNADDGFVILASRLGQPATGTWKLRYDLYYSSEAAKMLDLHFEIQTIIPETP